MTVALVLLALATISLRGQERDIETLIEAVRTGDGPIELFSAPPFFQRMSFEELVLRSDLIVRVRLVYHSHTSLMMAAAYLPTTPSKILKCGIRRSWRVQPSLPTEIYMTLLGGEIVLNGRRIHASHRATPRLTASTHGIFLLTRKNGKTFLVSDYLGAFEIRDGVAIHQRGPGLRRALAQNPWQLPQ